MCLLACLMIALQALPGETQQNPGTAPAKIQPKKVFLAPNSGTISGGYVCIEPSNLLTAYAPKKTIFLNLAPEAIGSFDTYETTKAIFLKQEIQTTPLGNAKLSSRAIGKDARKYPKWLWKGLIITLGCTIIGYIISLCLPRKDSRVYSAIKSIVIFGPLVPFLLLMLIFGFMMIVRSSVPDPKVDIYVDNATSKSYEIIFNWERIPLPPQSHICLNIRPRDHDLRIREKSSGKQIRFTVSAEFREGQNYVINLEQANRYHVQHKAYTMY
jgi:hypothetical protein